MAWYQVVLIFGDTFFLMISFDRPAVTRLGTEFEDDICFSFWSCCNEYVSGDA